MSESWRGHICWNCGTAQATQNVYGYPVCDECTDIDPEEMEDVVIESIGAGRIVPLSEIREQEERGE